METGIKVGDVMTSSLVTISENASIHDAAKKMKEKGISSLLVTQNGSGKIYGIVTSKDMVYKVLAKGKNGDTKVKDVHSAPLVGVEPEADISDAARLMGKEDLRRVVVFKNAKIVGILSAKDLIRISPSLYDLIAERAESSLLQKA